MRIKRRPRRGEILRLKNGTDIWPHSSVEHFIDELVHVLLVRKRGEKWFTQIRTFETRRELNRAVRHVIRGKGGDR